MKINIIWVWADKIDFIFSEIICYTLVLNHGAGDVVSIPVKAIDFSVYKRSSLVTIIYEN